MASNEVDIPDNIICPVCGDDAPAYTTTTLRIGRSKLEIGTVIWHDNCNQPFEIVPDGLRQVRKEDLYKIGPNPWDWRVKNGNV